MDKLSQRQAQRRTPIIRLMPLLVAAGSVMAGELPNEGYYFDELPVVFSATRLPQTPLELPAALTIIDQRMITASGANDIPELLRLVAGFQIAHLDGIRYAVSYHGMGEDFSRRIQVLVDGRSVYMPATSSVDWADLPLVIEDIERIEVLRGPNGVAFGDNSFTGVVNIITQEAKSAYGSYARLQTGQGNFRRAVVRQGERLGDLDLRLTLEHRRDDGLDDVALIGKLYSLKDDKQSNKLSLRGDWHADVNDHVQFNAGVNSGARGHGYNETTTNQLLYYLEPPYDTHNWRHFEQVRWRHIFSFDNEMQLQLYHDYTDTRATFQTLDPLPVLEVNNDVLAERYALELEHRFRLNDSIRLVWGGEVRFDQVTAPGFLNSDEARENNLYRGFAHTEWQPADGYLINVGAMLEHNDIAGTHLSPRLALNYRLSPHHAMRVSATRAYRTPAVFEEYIDYSAKLVGDATQYYPLWTSQGDLQSEQITSYEIGWMGSLDSRNQYDIKLFKEQIRDVISHPILLSYPTTLPPPYDTSEVPYFVNQDWADLQGFEGQLKVYASDDTMLSFAYSHVEARGTITHQNNPLRVKPVSSNVPRETFAWLVDHQFDSNWSGSLFFYHIDHMAIWHEVDVNTVDMRVARRIKRGDSEGQLSLVARDIGSDYYDYQDERVVRPRLYLSLEYTF